MPTPNSRRSYSGGAKATTLSQAVSDVATSLTLSDASSFPAASSGTPAAVMINRGEPNEEVIYYSPKSGNILTNCERGQDGTQAFTHAIGEPVEHVFTALDADEANAHYGTTTASFVPHSQHVHLSVAQTISAAHTHTGNEIHQGSETFATATVTDLTATTLTPTTVAGNFSATGNPTFTNATFTNSPTMPMGTAPVTLDTGAAADGTSVVPARADHKHGLDMTAILNAVNPAGKIEPFAGATAPTGWLKCEGGAVSRTTYPALFTAIGTTWGSGDGTTTFNLPDLRGKVLTGVDASHALGASGGSTTKTLTTAEIPAHNHPVTITDPGHKHAIDGDTGNRVLVTATGTQTQNVTTGTFSPGVSYTDIDSATTGITAATSNTGGGTGFNIEQPWAGVNYIIKAH